MTCGIYALSDPRDPLRYRYIGSSTNVEKKLYAHSHSSAPRSRTPLTLWLRELKAAGYKPVMEVLKEMPEGSTRMELQDYERFYIDTLETDLNVHLTSLGHANSKDSGGKKLHAELVALRQEVAFLRAENSRLRCNTATPRNVALVLHVAEGQKLQRNAT